MNRVVKSALGGAAITACLVASVAADGLGNFLASAFDPLPAAYGAPIVRNVRLLDKPGPAASVRRQAEGEDPREPELIEAALEAAGYFQKDVPLSYDLQDALHTACTRYGIDYAVALGLIEVESAFDVEAVNPASGCYGLTQLNPRYHPSGLSPADNIEHGIRYLSGQIDRYGSLEAGLQAYHDGHDTGARWYANAVLEAAERWKPYEPLFLL